MSVKLLMSSEASKDALQQPVRHRSVVEKAIDYGMYLCTRTVDQVLSAFHLQLEQHWSRVVMDSQTEMMIKSLDFTRFRTLEISGEKWGKIFDFREYKTLSYPTLDICRAPLDETFDLIIAEQVWEHLLWPYRATKNVYEMLSKGGYFLLTTPFLLRIHKSPYDCSRWTETGLKYLLAEAGFPLEHIRTGAWGNRRCIKANFRRWMPYRSFLHSLQNEPDFPIVVWAIAQKK